MGTGSGDGRVRATGLVLAALIATVSAFVEVPYNKDQKFGPDGPWQAVEFGLKYSTVDTYTNVNVYPSVLSGTYSAIYVPGPEACKDDKTGKCGTGGSLTKNIYVNASSWASYTYTDYDTSYYFYLNGTTAYTDIQLPNQVSLTDAITDVLKIGDMTYPNGKVVPIEVGYGCLGGSPLDNAYNAPLTLWQSDIIRSNSYGLHIGAAALDYPGSLVFGGYDRGRIAGPVIKYSAQSSLSLIDIEIGVETGDSPFDFEMQTDLLKIPSGGQFTGYLPTYLKPEYPYIFINQETIDAVANLLPVTFSQSAGYYLWDTQDPKYKEITSSPAYLGFVFPSVSGDSANTTIKVPFKLLDLTLESSVTGLTSDVPYLPLMAAPLTGDNAQSTIFGRAFLQAAFMGTNWNTNTSWLAQAPGPGSSMEGIG